MRTSPQAADDRAAPALLNMLALTGVCAALAIAFYYQLVLFDLPCPLCLLQRAGLILIGLGFLFNIRFGVRNVHYGLTLIGCLATAAIGMRQVLLHVQPGNPGYGEAFIGLHFYTWAVLTAVLAILAVALMMMLATGPASGSAPGAGRRIFGRAAAWLFTALIAANLVSTVLECGAGACADDPTFYELLRPR